MTASSYFSYISHQQVNYSLYMVTFVRIIPVKKEFFKIFLKKHLTNPNIRDIIIKQFETAGVAQLVEQLICNQQVGGSSPSTSSNMPFMTAYIYVNVRISAFDIL